MKRIVIAEDFNTSRQIIKKTLENMGYHVDEASDGKEALGLFDGRPVDLLITDYNMPNMNGAELIKNIRNSEVYKYVPIFVLSTDTNIEKQQKAKEAMITAWIRKPFEISEFKKMIEKVLS
ncbi:MAG TPA: response regulator [Bacteroidales bacterium]|nr:response regulator [Bacteroidales bacterium]